MKNPLDTKYAVVGIGGIFPDAPTLDQFWENILNKHISIAPMTDDQFDHAVHFRPDVYGKTEKKDTTYTNISASIQSFAFDSRQFKIAPAIAKHMDDNQRVSLLCAQQAISGGALNSVDKNRVSVFIGNTMGGQLNVDFMSRFTSDRIFHHLKKDEFFGKEFSLEKQEKIIDGLRKKVLKGTFMVTEDSAPGVLPNIIAARICSVFDLHGHAFVIDAACASALAAINCGIQQLKSFEADAVLCGGVDMLNREGGLIYFSGINALSPDGSYPFDARANGFVIGQGGGVVIIKRLRDAIASADTIYAVITGYGQVSDGKGKAIAAPNDEWQAKSIERACEMAGYPVETIELIEAHGTSTQVGDLSEVKALKRSFNKLGAKGRGFCGIGSVKSNIGHLKSAAGIAGFLKTVLALHHKILPPTANFQKENPQLNLAESPFYVIQEPAQWVAKEHPRRAGVSAFGFGGADYHIALEEYRMEDYRTIAQELFAVGTIDPEHTTTGQSFGDIAFFSSNDHNEMLRQAEAFARSPGLAGENFSTDLFHQNYKTDARKKYRLSMIIDSAQDLLEKVNLVKNCNAQPEQLKALSVKGIYWNCDPALTAERTAVLFPGQGSQYPDMTLDLSRAYTAAATHFSRADALWKSLTNETVSSLIDSSVRGKVETEKLLKNTANTHPAVMTASLAIYGILKEMNFKPGILLGHSLGEVSALAAAGKVDLCDAYRLIDARRKSFEEVPKETAGSMAALTLNRDEAAALIRKINVSCAIANINSPVQTIVSGNDADITLLLDHCVRLAVKAVRLNVSHAFHSPLMKPAEEAFKKGIAAASFNAGTIDVFANESNKRYGTTPQSIRSRLSGQITASVNFMDSIQKLYDEGFRLFIEIGPGNVLSTLTRKILEGKNAVVLSADNKNGSTVEAFNRMLCGLFAAGLHFDLVPRQKNSVKIFRIEGDKTDKCLLNSPTPQAPAPKHDEIVYSGVAVGLPGSFKSSFRDDNFQQLFDGHNFIERLSDRERERLAELRITKLIKSEKGASYVILDSINQVIQLAGKIGKIDLLNDYHISEKEIGAMSSAIAHAVAAGYEALRDAHIPLIHEYSQTTSGSYLPDKWALPQEMQSETGIIFANGFPMVDPIISEVSRHISYKFGNRIQEEIFDFYDTLIPKITDKASRKILSDWFALNFNRLSPRPCEEDVYSFNHQLMNQISSQANNRLAHYINARGTNFQINAACSSTSTAVTLAEDLIRSGRVKRMIVIGADDVSSETSLPYIGAGFLSTGACSNEPDLYEAAVPFDKRRNGMVIGAGAIGIIVEARSECEKRGVIPICELLGTHSFNTAGHASQLDVARYASELEVFIDKIEKTHGIKRQEMAEQLLYMSHETYTPARGGCSESEVVSLRHVFGENFRKIEISNTKGMTGHTMGASIEDVVAAKALQYSKMPPVVNHKVHDPILEGLKLSPGGDHHCIYALRMAAGFGSQGNYILLRQIAKMDNRLGNGQKFTQWLSGVSGVDTPEIEYRGRILAVKDGNTGAIIAHRPRVDYQHPGESKKNTPQKTEGVVGSVVPAKGVHNPVEAILFDTAAPNHADVKRTVFEVIAEITGYSIDMLSPDLEIEADLGVDTVKQATILAMLGEKFGIDQKDGFKISDFPTIGKIIELFSGKVNQSVSSIAGTAQKVLVMNASGNSVEHFSGKQPTERLPSDRVHLMGQASKVKMPSESVPEFDVRKEVFTVISEITGYPVEMLEPPMEIEADLGVDTVKQATILAVLGEKFGVNQDEGFKISEFPTIAGIIDLFSQKADRASSKLIRAEAPTPAATAPAGSTKTNNPSIGKTATEEKYEKEKFENTIVPEPLFMDSVWNTIVSLFSDNSAYPPEMIEPDLKVKSDLNLTADAVATIRSKIAAAFNLQTTWTIAEDSLISDIVQSVIAHAIGARIALEEPINLSRQILTRIPSALSTKTVRLDDKRVWVAGDTASVLESVKKHLEPLVHSIECFVFPATGSAEECIGNLEKIPVKHAPDIFIDLTACGSENKPFFALDTHEATIRMQRAADCRFALCKYLREKNLTPRRLLVVLAADGTFGIDPDSHGVIDPIFGLYNGFYKALRKEWMESKVTIVDLEPRCFEGSPEKFLNIVTGEINTESDGVEVCYRSDVRHKVVAIDAPFITSISETTSCKHVFFNTNDVVIATGGGSGITSKIILELGQKFPTTIIITGRTKLVGDVEKYCQMNQNQLQEQKKIIAEKLKLENVRVTPIMIERNFDILVKSIEIYRTMQSLKAFGCRVRYYPADIRDIKRIGEILDEVRRNFGPVTALIHGAGVETSHTIDRKSQEEFRQVCGIKTAGAFNLTLLCKNDPLKVVVALSSISGQFGNAAQTDYSAANCFLNFWARMYAGRGDVRAVSLVWSGWAETGMAWRNSYVKDNASRMGLHLIDPELGVKAALREICFPTASDVVLHAGLGSMADPQMAADDLTKFPMIDRITRDSNRIKSVHRILSPQRDVLIDQHRLDTTPLMPGVGFMELMAESCALLENNCGGPFIFRNLKFLDSLKFYREEPRELVVEISPEPAGYAMVIKSPFKTSLNKTPHIREYCKASVSIEPVEIDAISNQDWDIGDAPKMSYSLILENSVHFTHRVVFGAVFNDLRRANRQEPDCFVSLNENGIITPLPFPKAQFNNPGYPLDLFLINPAFLDSIHQAGAICSLELANRKHYFLPIGAEEFGIVKAPKVDGEYRILAKLREKCGDTMVYDIVMFNEKNELCSYVKNSSYLRINQ